MEKYEGFVVLTKEEFDQKLEKCDRFPEDAPYNEGDVCWVEGRMYMSMENGNRKHPRGSMNSEWKIVFVDK